MFGLLADSRGCPVGVTVYPGNTIDSTTLIEQVGYLRELFGIERLVIARRSASVISSPTFRTARNGNLPRPKPKVTAHRELV
ncbi:MAG: hypothetical protein FJZ01_01275 [Candidatus Sericytochromatia bacterium]|nr:hypothetical protein [Candidatus Tanganyikabacteria bacterium]